MYLRLRDRDSENYTMFNMAHVLRVVPGRSSNDLKPWCVLHHFPSQMDDAGDEILAQTEISMSFDEMSMLLSGRFVTDPM